MYIIFQNYNKQEGTGKFIYNPLMLDNNSSQTWLIKKPTSVCKDILLKL